MLRFARSALILAISLAVLPPPISAQELDLSGMSGEDMLQDADERLGQMETSLDAVYQLRDQTQQEEADLTKLRCINDKIAAIQGFLRLSSDARDSLSGLIRLNDREGMSHQYTLIVIASQRVQNLTNEANQCAGEILTFAGEPELTTTIDEGIPDDSDLTESGAANLDLERILPGTPLPEATPYQ